MEATVTDQSENTIKYTPELIIRAEVVLAIDFLAICLLPIFYSFRNFYRAKYLNSEQNNEEEIIKKRRKRVYIIYELCRVFLTACCAAFTIAGLCLIFYPVFCYYGQKFNSSNQEGN